MLQSRALGDFQYKDDELPPEDCKVTAAPDTQSIPRSPEGDEFLIVACDGIWDVMSNEVRVALGWVGFFFGDNVRIYINIFCLCCIL